MGIESINNEERVFNPSDETVNTANVSGMDSYNLSARGFNSSFSSRLLTLTDGRMANVPSLRLIAYNTIPVTSDDVSQIEVVLGPSSALYGPNAHSGVVNICLLYTSPSPRDRG